MTRPSWDSYFTDMARLVSTRGTCDRLRVGAVLVRDRRIIATGYNGAPSSFDHCDDVGHMMEAGHCVRAVHAEQNALMQVARDGGSTTIGATLYCTHYPCVLCAKLLIQAGIVRIVCGSGYRTFSAETFLRAAGIEVVEGMNEALHGKNMDDSCHTDNAIGAGYVHAGYADR